MRYRGKIWIVTFMGALVPVAPTEAQENASAPGGMQITSCVVYSTKSADKTYDCLRQAAEACNGRLWCEIPIGHDLTAGTDVDPNAGFLDKSVKFTYVCGGVSRQRGPYHQNDHASMVLECNGPK